MVLCCRTSTAEELDSNLIVKAIFADNRWGDDEAFAEAQRLFDLVLKSMKDYGAIEERNNLLAKAWAKLEEAGVKHGEAIAISEVERIIRPVLFQQL